MAGAEALVAWARRLRGRSEMPEAVRPTVETWCAANAEPGPASETRRRETPPTPEDRKAALGIETFLLDCDGLLFDVSLGKAVEPDPWDERAKMLRQQGLRMLGDGQGAKLDDPLRIRLARVEADRKRVREAVDRIGNAALQRRSERFMALGHLVRRFCRETKSDPVDVAEWAALRDRAEALRGEPGLPPSVERAVRRVRERDARARAGTRPVEAFLETGGAHWRQREAIEETARSRGVAPVLLEETPAWRDGCAGIRNAGRRLLGETGGNEAEARAARRLDDMPRLRGRVREVLDRLEAALLQDRADRFEALADEVEAQAAERDALALHADDYGSATALAEELESLEALPEAARRRVEDWLARDRQWQEDLASAARLDGAEGQQADPAARREAANRPAVAEAVRRETARLARLPEPERTIRWTGEQPLVPGDRIRTGAGMIEFIVVSAGAAGGTRPDDTLQLRMLWPGDANAPPRLGGVIPHPARSLVTTDCVRAAWADEGLRELELARHESVPSAFCRLPCTEPVRGDRIAWTEEAGPDGRVRTIEARVTGQADNILYGSARLQLAVIDASGPGAPGPGSVIERTATAIAARGCFRAEWSDEAHRERTLNPPRPAPAPRQTLQQEQTRQQRIDRSEGRGLSAG